MVRELGPVFTNYRLWDAKASEDISFIEAKDVLGGDFGQSFDIYPFGEVIDRYSYIFVLIGSDHERAEEI